MNSQHPGTRSAAAAPASTNHLDPEQKKALDLQADAEHLDSGKRENLTRKIEQLGGSGVTAKDEN